MVAECDNEKTLAIAPSEGSFRKITIDELNDLGYELTGKQMPVGEKPYRYGILEIKNEDNKLELSFCYLYSLDDQTGIILTHSFRWYLSRKH